MENPPKKRASGQRSKKRRFHGNCYVTPDSNSVLNISASSKKIRYSSNELSDIELNFMGYRLIDISILFSQIEKSLCCKTCKSNVKMSEIFTRGLSSKFSIKCDKCIESTFRNTSMIGEKKNVPEINRRCVYAMRCIGQGLAGLKTFCCMMDLPPPIHISAYYKIVNTIRSATSKTASNSMSLAAKEEIVMNGDSKISVSGDGTWKTRGHSSRIGVATLIGAETGKVIDMEVMSSFCKGCKNWKGPKCGNDYEAWKESHNTLCLKNHSGSAGKMEVDGMLKMFHRSESKYSIQYINYIGDGDTKTFTELKKSVVYGSDTSITKIECVGHVQKRMSNRLKSLKVAMRGKKLEDGKGLSGKGRLTDNIIHELTLYYGNAIRSNKDSLMDMRKAVWAIFYHKRSSDDEPTHDFCPTGESSWCKFQRAKSLGLEDDFRHKNSIPASIMTCIKPVFRDLSHPDLLRRCLGGKTQNANESLNSLIWKFCPKTSGSSKLVADIAANEAAVCFNDGQKGRLQTMNSMELVVGKHCFHAVTAADRKRVQEAEKRASGMSLEARRAKRMRQTTKLEALKEQEGAIYEAGKF